jgi:hypothetical protein
LQDGFTETHTHEMTAVRCYRMLGCFVVCKMFARWVYKTHA